MTTVDGRVLDYRTMNMVPCPECEGTGVCIETDNSNNIRIRLRSVCSRCKGTGKVRVKKGGCKK